MPITQDRLTRLRGFGLSEYAARAYLALLDLGVAEARDVSTLSKVPQAKIYHVLEQLHEKGLAVILPEFPKKYAPVPFSEYLDRIHEEHQRAAGAIERDRELLADLFRVVGDTEVGNRGFFTVIRGRRNVVAKIQEMLAAAQRDVLVLGTSGMAVRYAHFLHELRDARKRDVRVRTLLPVTPGTLPKLGELAGVADVRARAVEDGSQASRVAILLVDNAHGFLINFLPDDDNLYAGKDIGVFTDQEAMVHALESLVEPQWEQAATYGARREELETGRLGEFTRVYRGAEETRRAFDEAVGRGARVLRALDSRPIASPTEATLALAQRLREAGMAFHAIVNVSDAKAARQLGEVARESVDSGIRHLEPRLSSRFWCLDDREAFFALAQREDEPSEAVVVHTSNRDIVASLREQFDGAWSLGVPLDARLRELERFPHVQPRDLGIGRLFEEMREAVVVSDAQGRVVLWNPAASTLLGHDAMEAMSLRVVDVLPDADGPLAEALGGRRLASVSLAGVRSDGGAPVPLDARLVPLANVAEGSRFVAIFLREPVPAEGRGVPVATKAAAVAEEPARR